LRIVFSKPICNFWGKWSPEKSQNLKRDKSKSEAERGGVITTWSRQKMTSVAWISIALR